MHPKRRRRSSRPAQRIDSRGPLRHAVRVAGRDLKSLADAVIAVRDELGLTQEEFAERGGLHPGTVQRVELMKVTPRAKTLAGLDRAAGRPSGWARAALEGRELPTSNESVRTTERYYDATTQSVDEKAILRRMIELVPSIRRRYGNEQADLMVGRIMTLASQSNLAEWASAYLQEYAAR